MTVSDRPLNLDEADRVYYDAYKALQEAREKSKDLEWAGTVRAAQLCIELSVKGILRLFDIAYPPEHDVSDRLVVIPKKVKGLPDHLVESIARTRVCSKVWEPAHALAVYGGLDTSPSRLFKETDAKAATECASDANSCLTTLLNLAKLGQLEFQRA